MSLQETLWSVIFNSCTVPYAKYTCSPRSPESFWSSIINSYTVHAHPCELTGDPSKFKIQLLYSFLNNTCMFFEVLLEFDIELIYSSLWNIYLSCDFFSVQYSTPISSQEHFRVQYSTAIQSSMLFCQLTKVSPEFYIELQ
jgi:hypothetical protein